MAEAQEAKVGATREDKIMNLLRTIYSEFNRHADDLISYMNKRFDESDKKWDKLIDSQKQMINDMKERNERWKLETNKLKENKDDQVTDNKVSKDSEIRSDNHNEDTCLLYTSRCV